jgi:signal transduction histidine kinase
MPLILNSTTARTARSLALLLICVLAVSGLLLFLDSAVNPKTGIFKLQTAKFQLAVSADAQPKADAWTDVALPDNWSRQRKEAEGLGWYSIRFEAPADTSALGLHVRRLSMAGEFYLNGHLLAPSMPMTEPMQRMWNTPQYRALPRDWLLAGSNEITVRLFAYRDYNGGLGVVEIGPDAEIYKVYTKTLFMHSTFSAAAIMLLGLIALLALTIGMRFDKGDGSPLFLGLSCVTWAIRLVNDYLQVIPMSFVSWGWITHSLGGWVPLFILMYCHRYLQIKRPKLERFMIGYTALCTILVGVYLYGGISKDMMAAVWLPFNFATDAYLLYILWKLLRGASRAAPVVLATALGFFVVSDVHDRLIVTAAFGNLVGFDSTYWRALSAVLLSFAFALLVADQLINAIDDAKQSRAAREQAQSSERSRITREIHDGIGAQLMTALRGVERGALSQDQITESLQDGLDELRLLMDSADIGSDLHGALFAWRNRWEPRLNAVDLTLDWHMSQAVEQVKLPQEVVLQVIRILQESVANVVKHAHATKIEVSVNVQANQLVMRISDNGIGLPAEPTSSASRGIRNMKQRAEQIGASYSIQKLAAPAHGTLVEMQLAMP